MAVVKEYMHGACRITVLDDAYADKTKEQEQAEMEEVKKTARQGVLAYGHFRQISRNPEGRPLH